MSEPIGNLATSDLPFVSRLSRQLADPGVGGHAHRFTEQTGYTSLAVLLLLLAGFILVSVGVVGLYVGRIFEQVKDRPLFLIDSQADGPQAEMVLSPGQVEPAAGLQPPSAST